MSNKKETFKGIVTRPFSISEGYDENVKDKKVKVRKKPKEYIVGDNFETSNEKLYNDLINKKRIK